MSDLRQVTEFRQREVILCHKVSWIIEIFINYVWIKHPNYLHPSQRKMLLACMHIVAAAIFSKFDVEGEHCSIPFQKGKPNLKISKRWKTLKTIWDGGSQDRRKWFSERECWFWICCSSFMKLHGTALQSLLVTEQGLQNVVWLFITCFFLIRKLVILLDFLENSSKF